MNKHNNFLLNINNIAKYLVEKDIDFIEFETETVNFIKEHNLDFTLKHNGSEILFSTYLTTISLPIKDIVFQNIKNTVDSIKRSGQLDDQDDGWIDDVNGGIPVPGVIAFANVAAVANAIVIANAGALANAAANANAVANANVSVRVNVMSRSSGVASAGGANTSSIDHGKNLNLAMNIDISVNAISDQLTAYLSKNGLNEYRQSALIKYLLSKHLNQVDENSLNTSLIIDYKEIQMDMLIESQNNKIMLTRVGLHH